MSQSSQRSIELFPSGSYRNFHFSSKPQYILLPLSYFRVRGSSGELDAIALKGLPLLSSHFLSPPPFLPHSSPSSTTNRFLTAPPLAELTLRAVPLLPLLSIHLYVYNARTRSRAYVYTFSPHILSNHSLCYPSSAFILLAIDHDCHAPRFFFQK